MTKILITGANSYIGTSFEKYMKDYQDEFEIDTVDMIDGSWREKDFSGYDTIFHVAGIAHSDISNVSDERKALYYRVNTDLAIETANKAKAEGVRQFIFMSSAIVYGESAPIGKAKAITRETPFSPLNFYGNSKVKAEEGIAPLDDDSFKVVILRPPMIYGPGAKGNYSVLSKLAKKLPIFPVVENRRSMLYIDNLSEFVRLMIVNKESGVFWPQNREYTNTTEMVKLIAKENNKKIIFIKGLTWCLKILSRFTGLVNKAFGNFYYQKELSVYREDYQLISLEESIKRTEEAK